MELVVLDREVAERRDRASSVDWDPDLAPDQFVARERVLQRSAFARSRTVWGLAEGQRVGSSCETYERRWPGGRVWLVASVWTAPEERGQGHATRMLRALADRCAAEPEAAGLALFSDVGTPIYERVGFRALPAVDVVWAAERADPDDGAWIRFAESALQTVPSRDPDQLEWQVDRARTRAELLGGRRPSRVGARVEDGSWMVWAEADGALEVLEAQALAPDSWAMLARAAARTAAAAGLAEVVAWDPGPTAVGARRARHGKVPMVLALRDGWAPAMGRDAWV